MLQMQSYTILEEEEEFQISKIARAINCYDASFEEGLKPVSMYLHTGFSKVTNVYFVLLILISKGYCRAFVVFPSL